MITKNHHRYSMTFWGSMNIVFSIFLVFPAYAEQQSTTRHECDVHFGVNRIITHSVGNFGLVNRDGIIGVAEQERYAPTDAVGLIVGGEYLFSLSPESSFSIGLGGEYHFQQTLERRYQVNLFRRNFNDRLTTEEISGTALYATGKYYFPTNARLQPYLVGRIGIAKNSVKYSYNVSVFGDSSEQDGYVDMKGQISDLRDSPYYAIGFGIKLGRRFFIEPLYSFSRLRYTVALPTALYEMYPDSDFTAKEKHDIDQHTISINMGYVFGREYSAPVEVLSQEDRPLPKGLSMLVGVNRCLPMNLTIGHSVYDQIIEESGEYAYSKQEWIENAQDAIVFSAGVEYLFSPAKNILTGLGVGYHAKNTYSNHHIVGSTEKEKETKYTYQFSNMALYAVGKYYFATQSQTTPYLLARLGYSFNDWEDYSKRQGGKNIDIDGSQEIDDSVYAAAGIGMNFSQYVSAEFLYSIIPIDAQAYYHASSGAGATGLQSDHREGYAQAFHLFLNITLSPIFKSR